MLSQFSKTQMVNFIDNYTIKANDGEVIGILFFCAEACLESPHVHFLFIV
jgi:hypothetical protein